MGLIEKNLIEKVIAPRNLNMACQQVVDNKGAGGIDGMEVDELLAWLKEHGSELRQSILGGTYRPSPVRRVEIPKDNGKKRMLGIPTAVDRVIQQAIAQVLTPIYEPLFSKYSYGFRPGRRAHDALERCMECLKEGYEWVVDLDLERFFDTVNHSKLIEVLSRKVFDGRLISLIHKFLNAGAVWGKRFEATAAGVPQGGPLSPILANVMLHSLDRELEWRGHRFARYADDVLILCRSEAAAKQALEHIIPYIEGKLFLKVNREKTSVSYAGKVKFLGYGFYKSAKGWRYRVHPKSKAKLKAKVKELTSRKRVMEYEVWKQRLWWLVRGWVNYYKLADAGKWLRRMDEWMRRRIRMVFWKKWKRVRTRYKNLRRLGLSHDDALKTAASRKGYWRLSRTPELNLALSNKRLAMAGFPCFLSYYESVKTA